MAYEWEREEWRNAVDSMTEMERAEFEPDISDMYAGSCEQCENCGHPRGEHLLSSTDRGDDIGWGHCPHRSEAHE